MGLFDLFGLKKSLLSSKLDLFDKKEDLFDSKLDIFGSKSGSLLSYKDGGAVVGRGDVKHGDEDALTHGLDGSFQFMRPGFQKLTGHTDKDIFVVDAPSSQYTVNAHHGSVSVIGNCTWDTLIGFEYVKFSDGILNLKTGHLEDLPKFDPMDASISGTAFIDVNKDGIDNDGKDLAHGKVLLLDKNYHKIAETETDAHGNYSFDGLAEGDYIIDFEFGPYTQKNVGQDDSIDSDVHSTSGRSDVISLGKSQSVKIDAGVLRDVTPTPTPPPADPDNLIVNGSFEEPEVDTGWDYFDDVAGWKSDTRIELQENGLFGSDVSASDGDQWLELDADKEVDNIYQDVQTEAGKIYKLSMDVAERPGGSADKIEVYWKGELLEIIDPSSTDFETKMFEVVGSGGMDRLEFREPAGESNNFGPLIDNVSLVDTGRVDTGNPTPTPPSGDENRVADIEGTAQQLKGSDDKLDIFVVSGKQAEFGIDPTQDGKGIVIWNEKGFDILFDFDKIEFTDVILDIATGATTPNPGYTPAPTPTPPSGDENRIEDVEGTTQQLMGSDDKLDIFVVKGEKAEFGVAPTEDGKGVVIWSAKGFDILFDFDKIEFTDVILDIASGTTTPNPGYTPAPAPQPPHVDILIENKAGQNETIIGTDAKETYVIDADKSDYGIAKTDDGGFVVYSLNEFDLLYNIEEVQFNDQTIMLDDYA